MIIFLLPKEFCLSSTLNLLAINSLSFLSLEKNHSFASISEGYFSLNTEKCFPSIALGASLYCLSGFQRFCWKVGCQSYPCLSAQFSVSRPHSHGVLSRVSQHFLSLWLDISCPFWKVLKHRLSNITCVLSSLSNPSSCGHFTMSHMSWTFFPAFFHPFAYLSWSTVSSSRIHFLEKVWVYYYKSPFCHLVLLSCLSLGLLVSGSVGLSLLSTVFLLIFQSRLVYLFPLSFQSGLVSPYSGFFLIAECSLLYMENCSYHLTLCMLLTSSGKHMLLLIMGM